MPVTDCTMPRGTRVPGLLAAIIASTSELVRRSGGRAEAMAAIRVAGSPALHVRLADRGMSDMGAMVEPKAAFKRACLRATRLTLRCGHDAGLLVPYSQPAGA